MKMYEVYEIKSVEYKKGFYNAAAFFQLYSYILSINANPESNYRPAIAGTTMSGINNKYLPYPLDPTKVIKVTTSYTAHPGMIYYEIQEKKESQKVEVVVFSKSKEKSIRHSGKNTNRKSVRLSLISLEISGVLG